MEVLMPGYRADRRPLERPSIETGTLFGLSTVERACVSQLIGHTLAHVEREFILQTLRFHRGNRTRAADLLGISIRSLRNKIRDYRNQGEDVPPPEAPGSTALDERRRVLRRSMSVDLAPSATKPRMTATHAGCVGRNPPPS
jgi:DNA-binding protein Fis